MTTAQPPRTLTLDRHRIPRQLVAYDQWVCWRWEERADKKGETKWTKVPINARTGHRADSTDPETWAPFSVACHYFDCNPNDVAGIGFVFSPDDPFFGIDIDKARDPETKRLDAEDSALIERFDTFTEWSITGTGAHIIGTGTVPPDGNRKGRYEIYDRGRFFVMSGNPIANEDLIGDRNDELAIWHAELFPPKPKATGKPQPAPIATVADDELLERCQRNAKFVRLWDGDDGDYDGDTSRADLAFCNIIVRAGGDRIQVDALYRRSGRAREKWDGRRGARTYGAMTLDEAFDGTIEPFSPAPRSTVLRIERPNPQDAEILPDDIASLKAMIIDLQARVAAAESRAIAAEERAAKLGELQSKTVAIIRNNKLGQERFTAVALAYQLGNREAAGDRGENGLYPIPLARIAESAGISEDTASKHVQKLAKEGVIRRDVRWIPEKIDADGVITGGHKRLFVGPATNVTDFVEAVARLDPVKSKNWGGTRIQCPTHPNADVIKETTWRCAECGDVLNAETETIRSNPQDAEILDDLAATGTDGPQPRTLQHPRGTSLSSVSDASSHNHVADPDQLALLAWHGATPVDRYTAVDTGRRT